MKWLVILFLLSCPASAHEWYEQTCCSGRDCAPVEDGVVAETKDGLLVTNFGLLSESDPRIRWSQDDRDHLCVSKQWINGVPLPPKLQCVYRKRKFM